MSELCLLSTPEDAPLWSLLLSDLLLISSFALSHPLYLSYFIFFSPYILKLLCFLSPLFTATSLLLLGFLTLSPALIHGSPLLDSSVTQSGFFQSTYIAVLKILRSDTVNEECKLHQLEVEAYRLVFDTPEVCVMELMRSDEDYSRDSGSSVVQSSSYEFSCVGPSEVLFANMEEKTLEIVWEELVHRPTLEEERSEGFLKEFDEFETEVELSSVDFSEDKGQPLVRMGSGPEAIDCKSGENEVEVISEDERGENEVEVISEDERGENEVEVTSEDEGQHTPKVGTSDGECTSESQRALNMCLGSPEESFGSQAVVDGQLKESEVEGGDDDKDDDDDDGGEQASKDETLSNNTDNDSEYTSIMTSFSSRTLEESSLGSYRSMRRDKEWSRTLACKLFEERYNVDGGEEGMDLLWETYEKESGNKNNLRAKRNKKYEEDEEEEDGLRTGQLCCLQALKFSGGKVNLGMKKPSLLKISKAIKGIGWLHHVTRHGKKNSPMRM